MFEGLNAIPWYDLKHAYGSAEEVPMWLRQLASDDEQVRQKAINHLGGSICHQGWICRPTAYAVPYLIELLQEPTVQGKDEILKLLAEIAWADPIHERHRPGSSSISRPAAPEPVPLKDAHAVASAGIPIYIALLDAPELSVRMQAASVLVCFPERARERWPAMQAAFEREETEQGQVYLAFVLSRLGRRLPSRRTYFVEQFHEALNEWEMFSAALALAWLEKTETPAEVVQLLTRVAIEAPASLSAYQESPYGAIPAWHGAINALCNLGSERLQFLAPLLEERLAPPRGEGGVYYSESLAMLLLFIVFGEEVNHQLRPEKVLTQSQQLGTNWLLSFIAFGKTLKTRQPPRPATTLTERQRATLLLIFHHDTAWNSDHLDSLLWAYALPHTQREMAAYLEQELPPRYRAQPPKVPTAAPPRQDRMTLYKACIEGAYPDLHISRTQGRVPDENSQEDYMFLANGEIVFRFPTQEASIEMLEREIALLRALQERLPLSIPNPAYASQGVREVGRVFVGYIMPPGKPLYKEMLESIEGEEIVQALADQLVSFLHTLHHMPAAELAHLSLPVVTSREALAALYMRTREELFPQMSPEEQAQIIARFEAFLDAPENFGVTPVVIHGSFGPETIIYQAKTRRISGIIGFSRVGLGDPARDFAGLLGPRGYGETFVRRFEPAYPELPALLERAHFYAEALSLEEQLRRLAARGGKTMNQMTFYP